MNILLLYNKIFIKQYALSVLYLLQCYITQVSEVTKPPPVGADPCVCPTPKGVPQRLNRWKYVVPTLGGHMGPPLQSGGYGTSEN